MTFDELYSILHKHSGLPDNGGLLCSIVADMIEDTDDIIPPSPETLKALREGNHFSFVSGIYYSIRDENNSMLEWGTYSRMNTKEQNLFVVVRCLHQNPSKHYLSLSFTAYKRNQ